MHDELDAISTYICILHTYFPRLDPKEQLYLLAFLANMMACLPLVDEEPLEVIEFLTRVLNSQAHAIDALMESTYKVSVVLVVSVVVLAIACFSGNFL
jgi:hypothetical protein